MHFGHNLVAAAIALMICALAAPALAGFCANNAGPSVLYCDDFSGLDPLSNYVIWNGVYQFSSISIVNQELALQNNGSSPGLAAAYIMVTRPSRSTTRFSRPKSNSRARCP